MGVRAAGQPGPIRCAANAPLSGAGPRPVPLIAPVLGLLAGLALAEALGPERLPRPTVSAILPLLPVTLLLLLGRTNRAWGLPIVLALLGTTIGLARYTLELARPPTHVIHLLADTPQLIRATGRVVRAPSHRPPERRNPFLPFDTAPQTQLLVCFESLDTVSPPRPLTGYVRVQVTAAGLPLNPGERVTLNGWLSRLRGAQNPGEPDWSAWQRRQGIAALVTAPSAEHIERHPASARWWDEMRAALRQRVRTALFEPWAQAATDEATRLLDVMVLGQRSTADERLNTAFLRAGGMHFLAVSGFHVGVLAAVAWWMVRRVMRFGRRAAAVGMLLAVAGYALVAEPNAPVLRAAVFVACSAVAVLLRRPVCTLNTLALAAGLILLANPLELFRPGFQLSFGIVAALLLVMPTVPPLLSRYRDETNPPREAATLTALLLQSLARAGMVLVLVSFVAYVSALPLTWWHFGRFAPWGIVGSLLLTPLVTLTIVASFATVLTGSLPVLGTVSSAILHTTSTFLLWLVGWFRWLPGNVAETAPPPGWLVVGTYAAAAAWFALRPHPRTVLASTNRASRPARGRLAFRHWAAIHTVALLVLLWGGWLVVPPRAPGPSGPALHVLAVGNGSATVLCDGEGGAWVLDCGTDGNVDVGITTARALRALGVRRLSGALVSHGNFDHYSGLPTLAQRYPLPTWHTSTCFATGETTAGAHALHTLRARLPATAPHPVPLRLGDRLMFGPCAAEVLWPPPSLPATWDENDRSLVIKVELGGTRVLLTGDLEERAIDALLHAAAAGTVDLRADVLLAPHHGAVLARRTEAFLRAVAPRAIIVSTRTPRPRFAQLVHTTLGSQCTLWTTHAHGALTVAAGEVRPAARH